MPHRPYVAPRSKARRHTTLLADRFYLIEDDGYRKLNGQFWQMVIAKTPAEVKNEIHETLLDMLDDGRIVMGPRGFKLPSPLP